MQLELYEEYRAVVNRKRLVLRVPLVPTGEVLPAQGSVTGKWFGDRPATSICRTALFLGLIHVARGLTRDMRSLSYSQSAL